MAKQTDIDTKNIIRQRELEEAKGRIEAQKAKLSLAPIAPKIAISPSSRNLRKSQAQLAEFDTFKTKEASQQDDLRAQNSQKAEELKQQYTQLKTQEPKSEPYKASSKAVAKDFANLTKSLGSQEKVARGLNARATKIEKNLPKLTKLMLEANSKASAARDSLTNRSGFMGRFARGTLEKRIAKNEVFAKAIGNTTSTLTEAAASLRVRADAIKAFNATTIGSLKEIQKSGSGIKELARGEAFAKSVNNRIAALSQAQPNVQPSISAIAAGQGQATAQARQSAPAQPQAGQGQAAQQSAPAVNTKPILTPQDDKQLNSEMKRLRKGDSPLAVADYNAKIKKASEQPGIEPVVNGKSCAYDLGGGKKFVLESNHGNPPYTPKELSPGATVQVPIPRKNRDGTAAMGADGKPICDLVTMTGDENGKPQITNIISPVAPGTVSGLDPALTNAKYKGVAVADLLTQEDRQALAEELARDPQQQWKNAPAPAPAPISLAAPSTAPAAAAAPVQAAAQAVQQEPAGAANPATSTGAAPAKPVVPSPAPNDAGPGEPGPAIQDPALNSSSPSEPAASPANGLQPGGATTGAAAQEPSAGAPAPAAPGHAPRPGAASTSASDDVPAAASGAAVSPKAAEVVQSSTTQAQTETSTPGLGVQATTTSSVSTDPHAQTSSVPGRDSGQVTQAVENDSALPKPGAATSSAHDQGEMDRANAYARGNGIDELGTESGNRAKKVTAAMLVNTGTLVETSSQPIEALSQRPDSGLPGKGEAKATATARSTH